MAGRVVRVCPPRDFNFDDLGSGSATIVVSERIDASQYDTIDLMVRVHTATTISTNGAITVQLVSDGHTSDDPSVDFFSAVLGQGVVLAGAEAVALHIESLGAADGIGSMVAVKVVGTAGAGVVTARLSIDLAMKTC